MSGLDRRRSGRYRTAALVALALAGTGLAGAVVPAEAATSFTVTYTVTSSWAGGFVADVTLKNTGDAVSAWSVNWAFPDAGQKVTSAWNATVTQSGTAATATNASYNGSIASGASTSFGFQGTYTSANPVPASFTVNGSSSGGGGSTTTSTTSRTTTTTTTTRTTTTTTSPGSKPTVAADGTGTYKTVQAAIDAVPTGNTTRRVITIKAGTYREIVNIPSNKPFVTLQGLGGSASNTVIVNNRSNAGGYGTSGSATVYVQGKDFAATNLTISNDYGEGSQAVALNVNADRAVFNNVRFLGNQDTLLVNHYRQYFVNCYVEGTVDFIFGGSAAVFHNSNVYEKRSTGGPVTAANTDSPQTYGILFYKSTITGKTNNTTTLGRPWGPAAQVTYRESSLWATIKTSQPWTDMSENSWKNARFYEYRNTGSGAGTNSNRPQLSDSQAANYTPQKYLAGTDGWNPIG